MNKHHQQVIAEAPSSCKRTMERALTGEASPRGAIKAFCLRCVGYLRAEVAGCTSYKCPLHAYRPFQAGENEDSEGGALEETNQPTPEIKIEAETA